ncbi:4-coumarate--CoA ligase-like 7, partial [Fragariocoptes setiger]
MTSNQQSKILKSPLIYKAPDTENLCHFLCHGLDQHADKTLVVGAESGRRWTGVKIKSTSMKLASILVDRCKLKRGQVCSIYLEEDDLVPICMLGVIMAGGTFNYLTAKSNTAREVKDTIFVMNSKILISNEANFRRVSAQLSDQRDTLKCVSLDEMPSEFSDKSFGLENMLIEEYNSTVNHTETPKNLPNWDTIQPDTDLVVIQFSSGTRKPKPIPRTHKNCCHLVASVDHEELMDLKPGAVISGSLALTHRPGIWAVFACLRNGSTLVVWNNLSSVESAFKVIETYGVTIFSSSIYFLSMLGAVNQDLLSKYNLSTFKHMITSGAKLINKSLPKTVIDTFKLETFRQCFGMTESGWVFLIEKSIAKDNYSSVGHICPGMEAKIVDRDTRQILPANGRGEVAVRGPQIFPGYITATSLGTNRQLDRSDFDVDGFFFTGDRGYYDENELVFIEGRYKELMIFENNVRFFPTEIESLISEHPDVECVCVVKVNVKKDSPYDIAKACITVKSGRRVTEKDILDYVAEQSTRVILSGGIEILTIFPRLPNGKIDRKTLSNSIMRSVNMDGSLNVKVEFGGGTELLFDNQKCLDLKLSRSNEDSGEKWTVGRLIQHLIDNHIKERPELFVSGETIRPGILVLVNDVDFDLLGGHDCELKEKDSVLFISTLHGG